MTFLIYFLVGVLVATSLFAVIVLAQAFALGHGRNLDLLAARVSYGLSPADLAELEAGRVHESLEDELEFISRGLALVPRDEVAERRARRMGGDAA